MKALDRLYPRSCTVPRENWKDKRPFLQKGEQIEYFFAREAVWELFNELVENNLLILQVPRCPEEVDRKGNPKYCPPVPSLISHFVKQLFLLKGKIQNLADNKIISLPVNLVNASANPIMIKEARLREITLSLSTMKNQPINEGWKMLESKGAQKKKGWAIAKVVKLKTRKTAEASQSLSKAKEQCKAQEKGQKVVTKLTYWCQYLSASRKYEGCLFE